MSAEIPKPKERPHRIKLPRAVLGRREQELSPEARVTEIIERLERGWIGRGHEPRDQRQWGDCNMVPDIFTFVATDEARRKGFPVGTRQYQMLDLHAAAGGLQHEAFQHGFNTTTIGGKSFLVDLTASQFLGKNGYIGWGPDDAQYSSGVKNDNSLVQKLVSKGFVPLTDENLQEYLRVTSLADDRSYVTNMTTELLGTVQPRPMELYPSDGIGPDFGL